MFCPNCGAQNSDDASTCQRCGFKIKGTGAPRFKGTVLMMNPQENPIGAPPAPAGAAPPIAPAAPAQAAPEAPAVVAAKPRLKGTMIGVAPPGFDQNPVLPREPAPVAPPPAAPAQMMDPTPLAPNPRINPMGGTMVADPGAFAFGGQAGQAPLGQQPAQPYAAAEGVPATLRGAQGGAAQGGAAQPGQATVAFSPGMQAGGNASQFGQAPGGYAAGGGQMYSGSQGFPSASSGQYGASPRSWSETPQVPTTNTALTWLLAIITLGIYPLIQWLKRRQS